MTRSGPATPGWPAGAANVRGACHPRIVRRRLLWFGAVAVVSGKVTGKTDTLPLRIEKLDKAYDTTGAFAIATLLVGLALITLVLKAVVEWRTGRKSI